MRILHICQRDTPDTGGSLSVATALVQQQRASGHEVWLLFLYGEPSHVHEALAPHSVCLGLDSSKEALRGIFALRYEIKRIAPDIIHSHDGILWPRLAFVTVGIPIVMHSHLPVDSDAGMKDRLGKIMVKATTNSLIGISLHTIETWVRDGYPASRIHYVPNGVDYRRFSISDSEEKKRLRMELGLPADKHVLLWVGRLHQAVKGTERVERIAGLLPEGMVLVVAGNGTEYEPMLERSKGLIECGKMIMAGSVSSPENYYKAADSYLFTSHREAFGLVILEAAFCGLPILAFPVTEGGGAVRLLKEFEVTMLDDNASDSTLRKTLKNAAVSSEPAIRNREVAIGKYSLEAVSERVLEVYGLCVGERL
ncbi:Alpha-galactosylglucosyldiacylglycerol synthase [Pontiella desulfatans]|uniref:Alpha-galactosylglucosyldiacylglycerol synthase n=1 Tax=Pontiella desulfatans TaxID=2750659 RepID=A0A6C2U426_PONDE|nr:glycosyltransferase family 4 protein [Pontiella desulfatans]VGO14808.1 Alpha-galactosylglucosyldiacylglycerol synthase [Pontiella desulfatans]